jgi:uncharacterized membrane protein
MSPLLIFGAFGIGIIAGLRAFTVPAVVCWATYFSWLHFSESRLIFLSKPIVLGIVSLLALGELMADKLPMTPSRTTPGPLLGRITAAAFSATAIAIAAHQSAVVACVLGASGALAGAFGGYYVRRSLVKGYNLPDLAIALMEDLVAVGGAFCLVRQIARQ